MKKGLLLIALQCLAFASFSQDEKLTNSILFSGLRARQIGPAATSGRVAAMDGVNSKPSILYIGAAGGGVWKTTDNGASFSPVFDEYSMAIGAITIDQKHPDTVWVGTGEPWVRNSVSPGTGIYRTVNGGRTWEFKGLKTSERIAGIAIDPRNPNTVYAAVQGNLFDDSEDRGVYKTTDGGTTWEKLLYVNAATGCASLAMDPSNPDVLYASMWEHRRSPDFFNSGGPGSALYKSTDGGKSWNKIHNGLPAGILGRIGIGLAPSKSSVLYISVEAEKAADKGIYMSADAGASWKLVNSEFNTGVRPFYFSNIYVDPTNEKRLFKAGLSGIVSSDGGQAFRMIGSGVHSDVHCFWVNPKYPDAVWLGCDGGVYRSLDGGYSFEMMMNLPLSQAYHVAVDNNTPYNVYIGLQDNACWYAPSSAPGGVKNSDWKPTVGGDGFWSFPHPTDPNIVYAESQGGNLVRYNKKDGRSKQIQPIAAKGEPDYRYNWNSPIHLSPTNPERMYYGAQYLFMSDDRGDSWKKISPDLTTNDTMRQRQKISGGLSRDNSSAENNTTIYSIAESPLNAKVIWVGTDDGNLQLTTDGGKTWNNKVSFVGIPANTWVSDIEPSRFEANACYVTFDGHRTGDKRPYLYRTRDLGKTWSLLVTPDIEGYIWCVKEDLVNKDLLFIGTEFGLYISLDAGKSWARFSTDFPKVAVHDIVIHPRDHALVCATHGRGIIIIDDLSAIRALTPEIIAKDFHIIPSRPATIKFDPMSDWFGGAGNFAGPNAFEGAVVTYYQRKRHTFGKMEIELYDAKGGLVRTFPSGKSAGINKVAIPAFLPAPKQAPTNNPSALYGGFSGPSLPDGTYTVKIKKGKEEFSTTVSFALEKNSPYLAADRQLQFETVMKLYRMTEKIGYIYYSLQDMHKAAEAATAKKDLASSPDLQAIDKFGKEAKTLKESLVSMGGDFYVDEGGESLREKISKMLGMINGFPGKPTAGQMSRTAEFEKEVAEVETKYNALKAQVEDINKKLTAAGAQPAKLKTMEEFLAD